MTDPERDGYLERVKHLEHINIELELTVRRWRGLSLAGIGGLVVLFLLTAAVLSWREQGARKDADYLRWRLENRREQRDFQPTASPALVGGETE
jgi:hypothetical protein